MLTRIQKFVSKRLYTNENKILKTLFDIKTCNQQISAFFINREQTESVKKMHKIISGKKTNVFSLII